MKKVLFATTALIATAGVASADIEWSATAGAGLFADPDCNGGLCEDVDFYNFIEITATLSGETDNGLTFGGTFDLQAGDKVDIGDFDWDGGQATTNTDDSDTFGTLFISGDFGTITFDRNGIDNLYDDDYSHDVMYEYDMAGVSFALTFNSDDNGDHGHWSAMLGYEMDALSASLIVDDTGSYVAALGYDVTPEISLGLEHDRHEDVGDSVTTFSAEYDNGMYSAGVEFDSNDDWSLSVGYTADGITVAAETDNYEEWEITGAYDLGGGLALVTGVNFEEVFYLGAAMEF